MNRAQLLRLLRPNLPEIERRFAVRRLRRREDSDVDVLVDFAGPASFDQYMGPKFYLEDLLGVPVDRRAGVGTCRVIGGSTLPT